jgi:hypothetical protein
MAQANRPSYLWVALHPLGCTSFLSFLVPGLVLSTQITNQSINQSYNDAKEYKRKVYMVSTFIEKQKHTLSLD